MARGKRDKRNRGRAMSTRSSSSRSLRSSAEKGSILTFLSPSKSQTRRLPKGSVLEECHLPKESVLEEYTGDKYKSKRTIASSLSNATSRGSIFCGNENKHETITNKLRIESKESILSQTITPSTCRNGDKKSTRRNSRGRTQIKDPVENASAREESRESTLSRKTNSCNSTSLTSTSTNHNDKKNVISRFGLIRVSNSSLSNAKYELFKGGTLGRNAAPNRNRPAETPNSNKIDIGIGSDTDGVSRQQMEVLEIRHNGVLLQVCENVKNSVRLMRVKKGGRSTLLVKSRSKLLEHGDRIEFDAYNTNPQHTFMVVKLPFDETATPDISDTQSEESSRKKAKVSKEVVKIENVSNDGILQDIDQRARNKSSSGRKAVHLSDSSKIVSDDSVGEARSGICETSHDSRESGSKSRTLFEESVLELKTDYRKENITSVDGGDTIENDNRKRKIIDNKRPLKSNQSTDVEMVSDDGEVQCEQEESQDDTQEDSQYSLLDTCEDSCTYSIADNDTPKKYMNSHLSNTLWRSLCSAEPQIGSELLTSLVTVHRMSPNSHLLKNISDLIFNGPKSEGFSYVDPNKTALVAKFAKTVMDTFPETRFDISWNDYETCLSSLTKSECLTSTAYALEHILAVFEADLPSLEAEAQKAPPDNSSITQTLTQCPRGLRKALRFTIDWTVNAWIQFAPFVISDSIQDTFKVEGAMRCTTALGKLALLVALVCCHKEDITNKDCAGLFRDAILLGLESDKEMRKITSLSTKEYDKSFKLLLVMSLEDERELCIDLQQNLAKMLKISGDFNISEGW